MERENIRFQSFYWLASLTRERHKHQPGLEFPRWEKQRVRACCLQYQLQRHQDLLGPTGAQPGKGRCHQAWRWDNQGGLGRRSRFPARSLWFWAVEAETDCGDASKKKSFSFNPHHQDRCSRTAALSKFCQNIVLHWSHRNITYCFSMLES